MTRGFGTYPVNSVSLNINRTSTPITNMSGETMYSAGAYIVTGSFSAYLRPSIYSLISTSLGANLKQFYVIPVESIVLSTDTTSYTLTNMAIQSCEMAANVKDFINVTFNFIAQKAASGGSSSSTSYSDAPAIFYNTVITANSETKFTSFSLSINREIDMENFIIGRETIYLPNGVYIQSSPTTISGSLDPKDYGIITKLLTTTSTDIPSTTLLTLPYTSCRIQTSVGTINMPKIYLTEGSVSGQGRQKFSKNIKYMTDMSQSAPITFS